MTDFKNVHVIANPVSGQDEPVIAIINRAFSQISFKWDISVTQGYGDGAKYAKQAVDNGADLICVYGGDGTVNDVLNGLYPSSVPMAMLSGGTGNGAAKALGIIGELENSIKYIVNGNNEVLLVDIGKIADRLFLLRVDIGKIVTFTEQQERKDKDDFGMMAYLFAIAKSFTNKKDYEFTITLDGKTVDRSAGVFILLNMSRRNAPDSAKDTSIQPADGVFNVFLLESSLSDTLKGITSFAQVTKTEEMFAELTGKEIRVETPEPLLVLADGEPCGETPITVELLPQAINLLVPKQ